MNQGSEVREYSAGNEILIRLTVEHDIGLKDVTARFEHDEGVDAATAERSAERDVIVLSGGEGDIKQQSGLYTTPPGATSTVLLRGRISADKSPGEYRCSRVETEYQGGRRIVFDPERAPDIRFRVVEQSVESPRVVGWEYGS